MEYAKGKIDLKARKSLEEYGRQFGLEAADIKELIE